ncbi:MAG: 50S ribosome-binding GTPase [Candidatus Helarchaeota archaeon]|nr:50S ribosome-binding GTPase [Candidatus Helarchaeota archaeon]
MSIIQKILFCGIDNAGKTSILHVLKKNYSFLNKLKPTKGIERSRSKILDIDFVLWDLGGQEQYITEYFDRKGFIFTDLSVLFFVIDIQDEPRFDKVLIYFENIISVLNEFNQSPNIIIFLHKVDPDIEHTENVRLFTQDLYKKIRKSASGFSIAFFQTSIFKRWSIIEAFSYGIRTLSEDQVNLLSDYLESWGEYFGANAVLMLSADDIVIGEYSTDDFSVKNLKKYLDELRNIYSVSEKPVILRMNGDLLTLNPLNIGKFTLYLLKYTNNPKITEKHFTQPIPIENQDDLENILLNFFQKV